MKYRVEVRLQQLMDERGLQQKDVADKTGLRPNTISSIRKGYIDRIQLDHIAKLAEAFDEPDISKFIAIVENKPED